MFCLTFHVRITALLCQARARCQGMSYLLTARRGINVILSPSFHLARQVWHVDNAIQK